MKNRIITIVLLALLTTFFGCLETDTSPVGSDIPGADQDLPSGEDPGWNGNENPSSNTPCTVDADCGLGEYCYLNLCTSFNEGPCVQARGAACTSDADCSTTHEFCCLSPDCPEPQHNGRCLIRGQNVPAECIEDSNCPGAGAVCNDYCLCKNEDTPLEGDQDTEADWGDGDIDDVADIDDSDPVDTNDSTDTVDTDEDPALTGCDAVQDGWNQNFMVDGVARAFILKLPSGVEQGGPWPVIFAWHGLGDTAQNMSGILNPYVNNNIMPFIAVTPDDTNVQVPYGMDWDNVNVSEPNKEARLFDEIVACLDRRFDVDEDRIHSIGFSAGSITTDMLGVLRGDELASVVTFSGGYLSNQANVDTIDSRILSFVTFSWPPLETEHKYAQLFVHGGVNDTYGQSYFGIDFILHFDQFAENDTVYLNNKGHDAVLCSHSTGHNVPSSMIGNFVIRFLADHPYGITTSPYNSAGLPSELQSTSVFYCSFRGKTTD